MSVLYTSWPASGLAESLKSFGRRRRTKVADERTRGKRALVYGECDFWCGERFDRRRCMSVEQLRCGIGARRGGFSCWSDGRSKPSDRNCRHRAQDGPSAEALLLRPEGGAVGAGSRRSPPGWAWPMRGRPGVTPALERLDDDHVSPQHGQDGRTSLGSFGMSSSLGGATARSSRARARLALRAEAESRP
jgi:hypothetical protein